MTDPNKYVTIYEVGPRDGLQNEKRILPTSDKVALIDLLSKVGFSKIEAASFVSPKWVPQMGDASAVMSGIERAAGVTYSALTPNMRGLEAAMAAGVTEVAIFGSASESFSQKNINCSIKESLERFEPVTKTALENGITVRGYISCVIECPYEGAISPSSVSRIAASMLDLGCYELSLGDTIGVGNPETMRPMFDAVLDVIPSSQVAGHFHDTNGRALENVALGLDYGIRTFDSAIGGLGGCPYAPGAKGNLSTISLFDMLTNNGWKTGLDREALLAADSFLQGTLNVTV